MESPNTVFASTIKITVRNWIKYRHDCIVVYVNFIKLYFMKNTCMNRQN